MSTLLLLLGVLLAAEPPPAEPAESEIPAVPMDDGTSVRRLVMERGFALDDGVFDYDHTADPMRLRAGRVIVVEVDPALARPRDAKNPVLYAGTSPVQIVARRVETGCLVGVVPPEVTLEAAPLYFGSFLPPEKVDYARGVTELAAAKALGILARPPEELVEARAVGGKVLRVADGEALRAQIAPLVDRCTQP